MNVAYLACSGWVAAALSAAARLRIADHLVDGPQSVESLAATTGTDPRVLSRVLRALVVFEVFAEESFVGVAGPLRHPGELAGAERSHLPVHVEP